MIHPAFLTDRRTTAGLSQRKLALLAGLNYQVIRRIEGGGDDGNLTLRDLARIAEALGVDPRSLLGSAAAAPDKDPAPRRELSIAEARLLRRIHRGEDVRRAMSASERELVLPALLNQGLVTVSVAGRPRLSDEARAELGPDQ